MKVSARRRKGYAHSLTAGHHTLIVRRAARHRRHRHGPAPARAARAQPRRVHGDHDRDVRGPQAMGHRRLSRSTSTTSCTARGGERASTYDPIPGDVTDEQLERAQGGRRQVPRASRPDRRRADQTTERGSVPERETRLLIGGEQVAGEGEPLDVENPYTEETLATVRAASPPRWTPRSPPPARRRACWAATPARRARRDAARGRHPAARAHRRAGRGR